MNYRAGLHLENQKFCRKIKEKGVEHCQGIKLSFNQDRALAACQILFSMKDSFACNLLNLPPDQHHAWCLTEDDTSAIIELEVTLDDYYEAFGLASKRQAARMEARRALLNLACEQYQVRYQRQYDNAGNKLSDAFVRLDSPILQVRPIKGLKNIRTRGMRIAYSPLFSDGLTNFFIIKPSTLHRDIHAILKTKGVSRPKQATSSLFISFLLSFNMAEIKISPIKLAQKLWLTTALEQRRSAELEKHLHVRCLNVASELGFINSYSFSKEMISIKLNEEKCKRAPPTQDENA